MLIDQWAGNRKHDLSSVCAYGVGSAVIASSSAFQNFGSAERIHPDFIPNLIFVSHVALVSVPSENWPRYMRNVLLDPEYSYRPEVSSLGKHPGRDVQDAGQKQGQTFLS